MEPISILTAEGLVATHLVASRYQVHAATVRRWCLSGGTARDGSRIRLEHVRTPGRLRTSFAAVERFLAQLDATGEVATPVTRTPSKRAKASADAREELRRMGV